MTCALGTLAVNASATVTLNVTGIGGRHRPQHRVRDGHRSRSGRREQHGRRRDDDHAGGLRCADLLGPGRCLPCRPTTDVRPTRRTSMATARTTWSCRCCSAAWRCGSTTGTAGSARRSRSDIPRRLRSTMRRAALRSRISMATARSTSPWQPGRRWKCSSAPATAPSARPCRTRWGDRTAQRHRRRPRQGRRHRPACSTAARWQRRFLQVFRNNGRRRVRSGAARHTGAVEPAFPVVARLQR